MNTPDTTEPSAGRPEAGESFEHLDPEGPVLAYVGTLTDQEAATMRVLLEGDTAEQAEAKGALACHRATRALVREFGETYYERALFYGHEIALKQAMDEIGGTLAHLRSRHSDALLEQLETIRDCYDREYRRATSVVPVSPSSD